MHELVASERSMGRVLAVLPAIVVGACVRVLSLGHSPLAARTAAAAAVALACWTAYRLLTARLTVDDTGLTVRGVFYDAHVPWSEVATVDLRPAHPALRALVWGVMRPRALEIRTGSAVLRPLAAVGDEDDDDMSRVVRAIRSRLAVAPVPGQRPASDQVTTV